MDPISKGLKKARRKMGKQKVIKKNLDLVKGFKKTVYCPSNTKTPASQSESTYSWKTNEKIFKH